MRINLVGRLDMIGFFFLFLFVKESTISDCPYVLALILSSSQGFPIRNVDAIYQRRDPIGWYIKAARLGVIFNPVFSLTSDPYTQYV